MNHRITLLKDAVTVLASPAEAQLDHLAKLGLPDWVDELALEYDDAAAAAEDMLRCGEITQGQHDEVKALRDWLAQMSGADHASLWTAEALSSASAWWEVRKRANACLKMLAVG